jgi:hypothetical protein
MGAHPRPCRLTGPDRPARGTAYPLAARVMARTRAMDARATTAQANVVRKNGVRVCGVMGRPRRAPVGYPPNRPWPNRRTGFRTKCRRTGAHLADNSRDSRTTPPGSCRPAQLNSYQHINTEWPGWDSNPHALRHRLLRPAWLPVTPPGRPPAVYTTPRRPAPVRSRELPGPIPRRAGWRPSENDE